MDKDIKHATVSGVFWSSLQRFGMMFINLASNIVLARLLTPDDFGCVAMLMIFISLANTIIDGGFGSALIQKENPTQLDYSTIFYLNVLVSVLLYVILFLCSPLIAAFYRMPQLSNVLKVQGCVLIFNALSLVQQNILRKNIKIKTISIVYITSGVISFVVALMLAHKGFGVWSLVSQQLSMSLMLAILFWLSCSWRPILAFSLQSFKELFGFGSFMLLTSIFSTLSTEIQGLLVGRRFNSNTLGLYNQAYRLEGSAANAIGSLMDQVTFPVFSSLQKDTQGLTNAIKRFIQIPSYLSCFVMMILIVIAEPLVTLLYTEKWSEAVPFFQILCFAGLAVSLQGMGNNVLAAVGKSKVLFHWTLVKRSITIVLCFVGIILWGMRGLLWMCVIGSWSVYFINSYLIAKHIGYSFYNQTLDILPSILLSVVTGLLVYYFTGFFVMNMFVKAMLQIICCVLIYFLSSIVFKLDAYQYLRGIILERVAHKK